MPSLSDLYWGDRGKPRSYTATIVALSSLGTVDISWGGATISGVNYLNSYSPTAGDVVAVIVPIEGSLLVLGKLGTGVGGLGPNLLPNPSFELGTPGLVPSSWSNFWSAGAGQGLQDVTVAHTGGASARYDVGLVAAGNQALMTQGAVSVDTGATYRVGAWFKANAADAAHLTVITEIISGDSDINAAPFGTGSSLVDVATGTVGTTWTEYAGTRVIPAGHIYARVLARVATTAGFTVAKVWCDDVTLRKQ